MKTFLTKSLYVLIPIFFCSLIYLSFAFNLLELNPIKWEQTARGTFTILSFSCIIVGGVFAHLIDYNTNK